MSQKQDPRPSVSRIERASGRRFFVYAPPLKGVRKSKRKPPKPPFDDAKPWQCSVYYFWWKYLRANDGYIECCERGGRGKFAQLYKDFGDIRSNDFWAWWKAHDHLFSEPPANHTAVIDGSKMLNRDGYAVIAVPTDIPVALAMQQIKRLLPSVLTRPKRLTTDSKAQYPVATKPVLSSLHMHLRIWEGHNAYPEMKYHELADKLGLAVHEKLTKEERADFKSGVTDFRKDIDKSIKRRKILLVSRHLRIARQYIKNVGKGYFPKREGR